jgi:16S rRNA (guanine527-N7)-methyltransferase
MSSPQPEREHLRLGAQSLGLSLDPTQLDRLQAYLDLLLQWNKVYNLTAIKDRAHALRHHLLDSLSVVVPLERHLAQNPSIDGVRVLDVGSGGGLPGVVLAILCPSVEITCVDTVAKKAGFIRQAAAELALRNLTARHSRVEDMSDIQFHVITSRAFSSLPDLVALTRHLLASDGVGMAMKGQRPDTEMQSLSNDIEVFHVEPLQVPELDAQRCLVWMRPQRVA